MKKKFILLAMMLLTIMGGVKFNVLNAQHNCSVDFILNDSYGDGWEGGLTVSFGSESRELTLTTGKTTTHTLSIPTGSNVTVSFSVQNYASECSFTIKYTEGDDIMEATKEDLKGTFDSSGNDKTFNFTTNCEALPPSIPVLTGETTGETTIALSWNDVGADTYTIYHGEDIVAYNITSTNYTVENLNPNTQYCFTVTATNIVAESDHSSELCATTFKEGSTLVTIGEGTNTTPYAPIYNYYSSNSVSQTIYTSAELGNAGFIKTISFRPSYADNTRNISIYLKNVNRNHFYDIESSSKKWEDLDGAVCVFSGSLRFAADVWTTISLQSDFLYEGSNLLVCVIDNTSSSASSNGNYFYCDVCGTNEATDIRAIYKGNSSQIDYLNLPEGPSALYSNSSYFIPQVRFLKEPAAASLEVSETSIALGNVRMGKNFFTEKPFSPKDVEVKVTSTTVTNVTCDNNFFTIELPAEVDYSKTFTFSVGYNKEANVTEPQNGTITIKWQDGEDVTIPVSATPYTATAPDAIEAFTTVTFDGNNAYTNTPTFANLHDDYILPGEDEATNGNAPDAVYKFELTEDATISASITGDGINNSYLAIYNAKTIGDGPSSNNNDQGVQSGPQGPTTFFYDFNNCIEEGFSFIDADGDGFKWQFSQILGSDYGIISYSYQPWGYSYTNVTPNNYIVTNDKYSITNMSKLSFSIKSMGYVDKYGVMISEDDTFEDSDIVFSEIYKDMTFKTVEIDFSDPVYSSYVGKSVYIGIRHYESHGSTGYGLIINNLALTDGSSKSRAAGLATIDGVQYPAGTYYLVAAADNAFTVNLSTASVPAPAEFALTAPEDNATGQNNPKLTWETAQYATEYNVYLGTSEDLTNVEPKTVTTNSYQTEGLQNNTKYYWTVKAVNDQGTTATTSETWSFVTTLDVPTITSEKEVKIFTDETATIEWEKIDAASGYNVYNGGTKLNEQLIEETSYTLEGLAYNMTGYNITVKAVYDGLGESEASEAVNVKVSGYGKISLVENNGVGKVNYTINGTDEFDNAVEKITGTTNNEGTAVVEKIKAGTYIITVSKYGYKDATSEVIVKNTAEATEARFSMVENPTAEINVVAVDNVTTANVSWTGNYEKYNVYRRDSEGNVKKIASDITDEQYQDTEWNGFTAGDEYEYGVSTYVGGETETLMNEGFEHNGNMPNGWNNFGTSSWNYGGVTSSWGYYYSGSYGYYMGYTSGNTWCLTTPQVDLKGVSSATLSLYYKNGSGNTFNIYAKVNDGEWSIIKGINTSVGSFTKLDIPLESTYIGQVVQIKFECIGSSAYTVLDDIVISAVPMSESAINWAPAITKEEWCVFNGTEDNAWSNANNWSTNNVPENNSNIIIAAEAVFAGPKAVKNITINNNGRLIIENDINEGFGILYVSGKLTNATSANLVMNDGTQIYHNSENVMASFNMNIANPEEWSENNKDGWQFIASPFAGEGTEAAISNFTTDGNYNYHVYDLYKYNGTADAEWDNHKEDNSTDYNFGWYFTNGLGYLASYQTLETATLKGALNPANSKLWSFTVNEETTQLENFHLIGNPFSFDMDMSKVSYTNMVEGVAVVTADGGYDYNISSIHVGDGFFVKTLVGNDNATMSYNNSAKTTRGEKASSLIITATSNEGNDNVVVNFNGEKEGFNKLQNFNEAIATVYVQNEGKNYGIANFNEDVQEIELCFNANQMGNYTISIEPNGKFQSVTLVDRFTGIETNMLLEDYHFTAMSNVNNNRFIVKLVNGQQTTDNSHFAYVMGEELIIEAEGAVEIIDMMGRVVYSNDAACHVNRINVSAFDNAAYVIRVVNENGVKVQKIIL